MLDFAVFEFEILCLGYDFQYVNSWYYFVSALQNPWVDKKVYVAPVPEPVVVVDDTTEDADVDAEDDIAP